MKYLVNGKRKTLEEMTSFELSEVLDKEFDKTEKVWIFFKPLYVIVFTITWVSILISIFFIIFMLFQI